MTTEANTRMLVCDDQEIVRGGVKAMLAGTEIRVVGEATTGQGAVKQALEMDINLMLLDVRMPDGDGLTALGRIKLDKPDLAVVMFSAFDNPSSVARAIALGAGGFLLKDCNRDDFVRTIRAVANGENVWSREKLRSVSGRLAHSAAEHQFGGLAQRARGRSAAAHGHRIDEQADRAGHEHQL